MFEMLEKSDTEQKIYTIDVHNWTELIGLIKNKFKSSPYFQPEITSPKNSRVDITFHVNFYAWMQHSLVSTLRT